MVGDGFVARYMGDGVLAYFGYLQAHEDADYNQAGANANADLERFNAAQLANRASMSASSARTARSARQQLLAPAPRLIQSDRDTASRGTSSGRCSAGHGI